MSRLLFCSVLVLSACFSPTVELPREEPATTTEEVRACRAGSLCTLDTDCCLGHFCDASGYGDARCSAARANGAYCSTDSQCRSGICQTFECSAQACKAAGSVCSTGSDCCAGNFCDPFSYGPTKCRPLRADGAYCDDASQCQTGECHASQCGPAPKAIGVACTANAQCLSGSCQSGRCAAVCSAEGTTCSVDADCCGGGFCNNLTYAPPTCFAPQANGGYCTGDAQCQSGSCAWYTCTALTAACVADGDGCQGDTDCCAGSYCNAPFSYVPVPTVCTAGGPAGEYCQAHRQCASGSCVNNACAP